MTKKLILGLIYIRSTKIRAASYFFIQKSGFVIR